MSYTVTCGCYTEEFSLDCNITDVQAYFNVSGGGLLLNGMGPVVRRVYDGCAYELRGANVRPPKTLEHLNRVKLPNGTPVVTDVTWVHCDGQEKGSGQKLGAGEAQQTVQKLEELFTREEEDLQKLNAKLAAKPVEWAVVGASTICIMLFCATLAWYLVNYDPTQELALRDHGDKMTVESLTAISLAFAFGCLAFFSS